MKRTIEKKDIKQFVHVKLDKEAQKKLKGGNNIGIQDIMMP